MTKVKLNEWAKNLLDTGKRNNLINFKDSKAGTAEILSPDFVTLFTRAEHAALFEVYDPKTEAEDDVLLRDGENILPTERRISRLEYLATYEKKLKRNQILVYNIANRPLQALKNIGKKARTALEETGVNVAYLAFGFIHWTDKITTEPMRAPILLIPVSIQNDSPIEPCYVKVVDDEMIVNPTFSFKLQNEYGVSLPEFDEDEGIEAYFDKIEELLFRLQWTVSRECKIGVFSFLKINMYKDLTDNTDFIVKNGNVRTLLGEPPETNKTDVERIPALDLLELANVVDADSSQAEAIRLAKEGESFVLQGPPGTGKSQTITNVIAECLNDGKKVLFVSEKSAALNVVYNKLKEVGLEEFCLELHSHKASKKQVIEELCHTLKLAKSGISSDKAAQELRKRKEAQTSLDDYAKEIHAVRPYINKSFHQLHEELAACRTAPSLHFILPDLNSKGEEYLEKAESALTRYVEYTPTVGYDYRACAWYGYANPDYSYATVLQLKEDLQALTSLCERLTPITRRLRERYRLNADGIQAAYAWKDFFVLAKDSEFLTPAVLNKKDAKEPLELAKKMQILATDILAKQAILNESYDKDVYALNGGDLYKKLTRLYTNFFTRLFNRDYKSIALSVRMCKKDGKRLNYKQLCAVMSDLYTYQEKTAEFTRLHALAQPLFGSAYNGVTTDFARLVSELEQLKELRKKNLVFEKLAVMPYPQFQTERTVFAEVYEDYQTAFTQYGESLTRLNASFNLNEYDVNAVPFEVLRNKFQDCLRDIDKLDNWCEFYKLLQRLKALGLQKFVDLAIEKDVPVKEIVTAFKKVYYRQWTDAVLHDSPFLTSLTRISHDETVERFKEKDRLHFEINKTKIKAFLSNQRPSLDMVAQGSSIAILLREGEKKRKQKSIRALLSEIGELAQTLKPCFLMSPLSVSTYLSPEMQFDTVIFDEASQIFPQDAIGTIYRGKQLIVVGDSKQMPPSNFFTSMAESDNDGIDEDITDFESILDLCSTAFRQCRLKWHYRSRFEELVAFSNKNFYDGDLVTFPAAQTDTQGTGVDFYPVDGTFDRLTKTNRVEAEKVADLIFEHIEKYPNRSLGVVAFSISQQTLIEKILAKRRRIDPSHEDFFRSDKSEPFFVKNLETVQGDERDTIIFSVAYAKDAYGKLLLNFGPINRAGGERRLNVAITRAKYNVQLVSSMRGADIDLSRTNSVGARLLKEYLDYAEYGETALKKTENESVFETVAFDFEKEVREFLQKHGYTVDTQVGCSSFKIDLAVKRQDSPDYLLAVECDGAAYRNSKTARDRDRLRQDILEKMGWHFYRIWSTDWFRNKRIEQEKLLAALKSAESSKLTPKKTKSVTFEQTPNETHFTFPTYEMADVDELRIRCRYDMQKIVKAVLKTEHPLSEEWFLKRIVHFFKREKVTNVVREEFDDRMQGCEQLGIIRKDGYLFLQDKEIPLLRVPAVGQTPRDVKYIELRELANGLRELLKQNVTAEKAGLFKLLAAQLGFERVGEAMQKRMEWALVLLRSEIVSNGDTLSLKNR